MAVERSSVLARHAGTALVVVGALGVLLWLWQVVRSQLAADDVFVTLDANSFGVPAREVSLTERLDSFGALFVSLVFPMLALGAGAALRLLADHLQSTVGGTVTGFEVGDDLDE